MRVIIRTGGLAFSLAVAACGGAGAQETPSPDHRSANEQTIPVGFGRLNQDDISIRLSSGDLEIRFVPLEERILRLLAPDAYRALHDMRESRRVAIDSLARNAGASIPGVALVTFFAAREGTRFESQDLSFTANGQEFRAVGTIPISANFSSQQLSNRGQASGLFIFDVPVPVEQEFTLSYQAARTDGWKARLALITREKDRIMVRVRADTTRRQ